MQINKVDRTQFSKVSFVIKQNNPANQMTTLLLSTLVLKKKYLHLTYIYNLLDHNLSTNQSINQSINQSTNKPRKNHSNS